MSKLDRHSNQRKRFLGTLENFRFKHNPFTVWSDWLALSANALRLPFEPDKAGPIMRPLFERYDEREKVWFDQMFDCVVNALEEEVQDFLGSVFMESDMGDSWRGQFFTPYHVCLAMAEMQVTDLGDKLAEQPWVTINDCCVGGGAMLIAASDAIRRKGFHHQRQALYYGQDIDQRCFHMAYIQFSLLGLPAILTLGDTLRDETRDRWFSPVWFIDNWGFKMAFGGNRTKGEAASPEPPPAKPDIEFGTDAAGQMLFPWAETEEAAMT